MNKVLYARCAKGVGGRSEQPVCGYSMKAVYSHSLPSISLTGGDKHLTVWHTFFQKFLLFLVIWQIAIACCVLGSVLSAGANGEQT